jgi:hypothetical protein
MEAAELQFGDPVCRYLKRAFQNNVTNIKILAHICICTSQFLFLLVELNIQFEISTYFCEKSIWTFINTILNNKIHQFSET